MSQIPGMGWLSRKDDNPYKEQWGDAERNLVSPADQSTPEPVGTTAASARQDGTNGNKEKLASYDGHGDYPDTGYPTPAGPATGEDARGNKPKRGFFLGRFSPLGAHDATSSGKETDEEGANSVEAADTVDRSAQGFLPSTGQYVDNLQKAADSYAQRATDTVNGTAQTITNGAQQANEHLQQTADAAQGYVQATSQQVQATAQQYTQPAQQYTQAAQQQVQASAQQYTQAAHDYQAAAQQYIPSAQQPYLNAVPVSASSAQQPNPPVYGYSDGTATGGTTSSSSGPGYSLAPGAVDGAVGTAAAGAAPPANDTNWQAPTAPPQGQPPATRPTQPAPESRSGSPWRPFSTRGPLS